MSDPTHTITIDGADSWGASFKLACDSPSDCRDGEDECNIQTWWDEIGIELLEADGLTGPPPWRVLTTYDGPDGSPTLTQALEPAIVSVGPILEPGEFP